MAIPSYTDLTTLKLRLGVTVSTYDSVLNDMLTGAGAAISAYLGYDPTVTAVTEYLNTRGEQVLPLSRYPITSVDHVYQDENGYYGQVAGAFASTTELVQGTDYSWDIDRGSLVGRLWRINWRWPFRTTRGVLQLAGTQDYCPGCVKAVYTVDNTAVLAACKQAAYLEASAQWRLMKTGIGAVLSESIDGYSVTVSQLQKANAVKDSKDNFVSPFVAGILRPFAIGRFV